MKISCFMACLALVMATPAFAQYAPNGTYGQAVSYNYDEHQAAPAQAASPCCGQTQGCGGGNFLGGCGTGCGSGGIGSRLGGFAGGPGYFSILGGWVDVNRYVGEGPPPPPPSTMLQRIQDFRDGYALGGAIGQYLNNGNRGELEFLYRNNSTDQYTLNEFNGNTLVSSNSWPTDGQVNSYAAMFNLSHDCNWLGGNFVPYFGGGIGVIYVDGDWNVPATGSAYYVDESAFAYQMMAGMNVNLTQTLACFTEFRYLSTTEVEVRTVGGSGPGSTGDFNYENASVMFGLRVNR